MGEYGDKAYFLLKLYPVCKSYTLKKQSAQWSSRTKLIEKCEQDYSIPWNLVVETHCAWRYILLNIP